MELLLVINVKSIYNLVKSLLVVSEGKMMLSFRTALEW